MSATDVWSGTCVGAVSASVAEDCAALVASATVVLAVSARLEVATAAAVPNATCVGAVSAKLAVLDPAAVASGTVATDEPTVRSNVADENAWLATTSTTVCVARPRRTALETAVTCVVWMIAGAVSASVAVDCATAGSSGVSATTGGDVEVPWLENQRPWSRQIHDLGPG
jgi:hypothetical protein